jgi:hypothetical protein
MNEELKPCPFCGSVEHVDVSFIDQEQVGCFACAVFADSDLWQSRPIEDALRAELAAAKKQVEQSVNAAETVAILDDKLMSRQLRQLGDETRHWEGRALKAEDKLAAAREKVKALLDQMNHVYENKEYLTAWTLYLTHMGNYKKNGGEQWTEEQDELATWLANEMK